MPFVAILVLALTIAGVLVRPFGVREWVVAVVGALVVVLLGVVDPGAAASSLAAQWNVFLFFVGLMTVAAIADRSGLLADLVVFAGRAARGRADLLLVLVSVVAVAVTVTLSNDATVLLVTPLVVELAARLGAPVLPYAFACAYIANTASVALPIANPANILLLRTVPMTASAFVALLAPSAILATVVTVLVLLWRWRHDLRVPLVRSAPLPEERGSRLVAVLIGATVVAYLVALERGWPVGAVALCGAIALVATQWLRGYLTPRDVHADIAWGVFPLLAGLIVVMAAAEGAGLVDLAAAALARLDPTPIGTTIATVGAAAASNTVNNLPVALLAARAAAHAGDLDPGLVGGLFVGIDVGPNFTVFGSLATLFWVVILRREGIDVSPARFARESAVPALAALVAALLPLLVRYV